MRRLAIVAVCAGVMALVSQTPAHADRVPVPVTDAAVGQTVWNGSFTRFAAPPDQLYAYTRFDARLVVTRRSGSEIEAEFWVAEDSRGLALRGRIERNGSLKLRVTKVLKGEWEDDLVGRVTVVGNLKRTSMTLRYEVPGERSSWGECRLHLRPYYQTAPRG